MTAYNPDMVIVADPNVLLAGYDVEAELERMGAKWEPATSKPQPAQAERDITLPSAAAARNGDGWAY